MEKNHAFTAMLDKIFPQVRHNFWMLQGEFCAAYLAVLSMPRLQNANGRQKNVDMAKW